MAVLLTLCFLFFHINQRVAALVLLSSSSIAILLIFCQLQHVRAATDDRSSLLLFKSAISVDPHGIFSGWNDTVHFCNWHGITCGHRHPDRVVGLQLTRLELVGTISPALANLTFLQLIVLSTNRFNGQIPSQLANLSRLQVLVLERNSLQGYIPSEFGSLPSLKFLHLNENALTGQIPPTLSNLSSLFTLSISGNDLSGVIPPSIGKFSILKNLYLNNNNLSGAIPQQLWNLSSLRTLRLDSNQGLYGSLPQDIGQALPKLTFLSISNSSLHGEIPLSLANVSKLSIIQLDHNNLGGKIPPNLGRLQYLTYLLLSENQLETANDWSFIDSLTNCTILTDLELGSNHLGGQLPKSLANLSTHLINLDISNNYIYGSCIPQDIGNLHVNLTRFDLGQNFLSGTIPASLLLLNNLHHLNLSYNSFSGEIPYNIGNLSQLEVLDLSYNTFNGSIPTSLDNCKSMDNLYLHNNKLTGTLPAQVVSIYTLVRLTLGNNLLQGSIPVEVGNLINLNTLIMSGNKLSGEIPINLGNCLLLESLRLDGNLFQGSIPTSLTALRGLEEVDLSSNNFSGKVPVFLGNFSFLNYLNLSFNNFEGELPTEGVFANITTVSVLGNYKLCGGNPMLHLQTCHFSSPKEKHKSSKIAIIISVASAFLFSLFVLVVVCYWVQRKSRRERPIANNHIGDQYVNVSYDDLVKATDSFSETNRIGSGSFGSVYRGKLDNHEHGTRDVAVKVFNFQEPKALKSFMVECEAFRDIRHRNIIKIITVCSSIDFSGNDFKALVFEFKANGSLESWLHREESDLGIKKLNILQRVNIAIDVASAIEYLHHDYGQTPIIHCDLKPSNILLNDDMTALVADFGIVKYMHGSIRNSTSSSGIKGTVGYIPPEYGMANQISTHGDVYSYGILLLELFTGKRPTDDIFKEGLSLRSFVEIALLENVMDVSILQESIDDEPSESGTSVNNTRSLRCVASVLVIGLSCSKDLPIERMEIKNVTNELKAIRNCFLEK